jgi:hypothetical protein
MALANGLCIIWVDTHIGVTEQYKALKEQFQSNLRPVTAMPPGNINELICYFEENVAPIKFVSTNEDALALIQSETDKRIIFISSGTLGQQIIPTIVAQYPRVYSYYIFCGYVRGLRDWALEHEYDNFMKMFDHETDLLVHLVRDTSEDIIELGKSYMTLRKGEDARKCFVTSQTLEISANAIDTLHPPLMARLKLLEGSNGLIEQARNMT